MMGPQMMRQNNRPFEIFFEKYFYVNLVLTLMFYYEYIVTVVSLGFVGM